MNAVDPKDRYKAAGYGTVTLCPLHLRLASIVACGYAPGASRDVDGAKHWAIDAICFDKQIGAFTAEYELRPRVYLHPSVALQAIRQWHPDPRRAEPKNLAEQFDWQRNDREYAEWLADTKCAPWSVVVARLRAREADLDNKEEEEP